MASQLRGGKTRGALGGVALLALVLSVGHGMQCKRDGATPAKAPAAPPPAGAAATPAGGAAGAPAAKPQKPALDVAAFEGRLGAADPTAPGDALAALTELGGQAEAIAALEAPVRERLLVARSRAEFVLLSGALVAGNAELAGQLAPLLQLGAGDAAAQLAAFEGRLKTLAAELKDAEPTTRIQELLGAVAQAARFAARADGQPPADATPDAFAAAAAAGPYGAVVRGLAIAWLESTFAALDGATEDARSALAATRLGGLACGRCQQAATAAPDALAATFYTPDNAGYVCPEAAARLAGQAPYAYPSTLAEVCDPKAFGLQSKEDLAVLTAANLPLVRLLGLAAQALTAAPAEDPFAKVLGARAATLGGRLAQALVALSLPWLPVPQAEREAQAARVIPTELPPGGALRRPLPLECVTLDETRVLTAMRPAAQVVENLVKFIDREAGYAFPGKFVIDLPALDEADKARAAEAQKAGKKVENPDLIPELLSATETMQARAAEIEPRAFGTALDAALLNGPKAGTDRGKTYLLAVDFKTPARLLRRTLATLFARGYDAPLLVKAAVADQRVLPTRYFDLSGVPEGAVDPVYKRPLMVCVGERDVSVYPPDKPLPGKTPARAKGERQPWPEGARPVVDPKSEKKDLFEVRISETDPLKLHAAVQQTLARLSAEYGAGNVLYFRAADNALAERWQLVLDAATRVPGAPPLPAPALGPGVVCDGADCPSHLAVLWPEARCPALKQEVQIAEVQAVDPCDRDHIKKMMARWAGSFRSCYEPELQLHPGLEGRIKVFFVIGLDGRVSEASPQGDTLNNRKVRDCVVDKLRGVRFNKPVGGECRISWPFLFQPH